MEMLSHMTSSPAKFGEERMDGKQVRTVKKQVRNCEMEAESAGKGEGENKAGTVKHKNGTNPE